jgi:hypothetical protein
MAVAGLILGALGLAGAILLSVIGWSLFVNSGTKDYVDCMNKAGSDQAKIDQCTREWNQTLENRYSVTITPQPTPTR